MTHITKTQQIMKKFYTLKTSLKLSITCFLMAFAAVMQAQPCTTTFANNNGNSLITFNFQNSNAYDVLITEVSSITGTTGANTAQLWYKPSAIAGAPGAIDAGNGWTMVASQPFAGVANTTTSTAQLMMSGLSFNVPAGSTYGLAFVCTNLRYSTLTAGTYNHPSGGCDLITGTNIGYGGVFPPTAPTFTPRGFIGSINFIPAVACSGTPAPGNTMSTANPVCPSVNFTLSPQTSSGTGVTYQWQSSPDGAIYTNIAGAVNANYTTNQTTATYYQLIVTCTSSGLSGTTTPLLVNMSPLFACYCTSMPTQTADEEIYNVTLGTLNNSSACATLGTGPGSLAARYANYTSGAGAPAAPNISQVTPTPFSVTINTCGVTNFNSGVAIFIDLNQNGLFTDAGEKVYSNGATANVACVPATVLSGNITIPVTATLGNTVMRVVDAEGISGDAITPCNVTFGYGEVEDYLINIVAAVPCSGTPSPGVTTSTANPVCPTTSFTLGMSTPPSGATGITYQWQSSPDGAIYSNIGGATNSTYTTTQSVATYYQVIVTCTVSGMSATSTALLVNMNPFMNCYCTSMPTSTADEEIFNVTVSTLNNTSSCATVGPGPGSVAMRYANYMSGAGAPPVPSVTQSTPEAFSVTVASCGGFNYTSGLAIFIDLNQNGSFADAGEKVYTNGATANINCVPATVVNSTFTIPGTALLGNTAMRVVNAEGISGNAITPCNVTFGWGEVEDYIINIVAAVPCAGTPSPGATTSTAPSVCSTTSFTLGMSTPPSGMTGITYQWQSSPDGGVYTNIGGATNSTYTTTQSDTTFYQVIVTCTNSGLSGTSTPIQVVMNSFMTCYCNGSATTPFDEEILNVTLSTLNNTSTCATLAPGPGSVMNQYSNYMTLPPTSISLSTNYPFSIGIGTCGGNYPSGTAIFIDYNQNGSYADPGEQVYSTPVTTNGPHTVTGSFTVPVTALMGNTGMRIINAEGFSGAAITPCLSYGYGETEDYVVNIAPAPPIDMMAVDLFFPTTTDCHTASDSVVITIQNNGSSIMDYSVTPVTVYASATGVNPATFGPIVLSTGTLAIGATQNVTVATGYNMAVAGTYIFDASTSVAGDGNTMNDTMSSAFVSVQGIDAIVDNDTVCVGDSVNLDVQLPPSMVIVGTGTIVNTTTTYPAPYGNWYWGARHQFLITAAELTALGLSAGPISSAAFDVVTTNSVGLTNFTIGMKMTATASLTVFETGLTTVYTTPSYIPVVGINTHTFGTAFTWDGISNIIIETCFNNTSYTLNCVVNQTSTPFASSIYRFQDAGGVCGSAVVSATANQRPNIRLSSVASYTYNWTPSGGMPSSTVQNPVAEVSGSTTYTVVVTNTSTGCTMTDTVSVFANPLPSLTLDDTTVCAGAVYTLDAQNAGSTYLWNTAEMTQTIGVSSGGLYFVDITTANGCAARDSITLTLNAQPLVTLGPDAAFCAGDSITIDAGNTGFTFLWNTSETTQTINASTTGMYSVAVTNPSTMCVGYDTTMITANPLPVVDLGVDTAICVGDTLMLDAGNPGATYSWQDASTGQMFNANTAGTYSVLVTDPMTTCFNADTMSLLINSLPVVDLGADTAICAGSPLTLDAGNPGSTYVWQDSTTMQTLVVMTASTYGVEVTDANGCKQMDAINVSVNALPMVNIGPDSTQCGGTIMLDAGNPTATYLWSDATMMQTLGVTSSGNYSVAVTDTNGCVQTDTAMITINLNPVVAFGPDITQCGDSITLDAGNPGLSYLWTNSTTNQTLTTYTSGMFGVTVTDTLTGCNGGDTINITINPVLVVNLGSDTTQCGGVITLDAGPGATTYNWYCSMCTNQTLVVNTSGTYTVTVSNSFGCITSDTIGVIINPLPTVGLTPFGTPVCLQAPAFTLTNGTPAGGVYSGTGVSGGMFDPAVAGVGVFSIMYVVTDANSCQNSTSQNITVQDCTGIEEFLFGKDINVYPNPTSGMFNITMLNANFAELTINITNIQGKVVYNEVDNNVTADYNKQINLEQFAKGIYYIRLSNGTEMTVRKLIVQ